MGSVSFDSRFTARSVRTTSESPNLPIRGRRRCVHSRGKRERDLTGGERFRLILREQQRQRTIRLTGAEEEMAND